MLRVFGDFAVSTACSVYSTLPSDRYKMTNLEKVEFEEATEEFLMTIGKAPSPMVIFLFAIVGIFGATIMRAHNDKKQIQRREQERQEQEERQQQLQQQEQTMQAPPPPPPVQKKEPSPPSPPPKIESRVGERPTVETLPELFWRRANFDTDEQGFYTKQPNGKDRPKAERNEQMSERMKGIFAKAQAKAQAQGLKNAWTAQQIRNFANKTAKQELRLLGQKLGLTEVDYLK